MIKLILGVILITCMMIVGWMFVNSELEGNLYFAFSLFITFGYLNYLSSKVKKVNNRRQSR